jgi:hypothetical protein
MVKQVGWLLCLPQWSSFACSFAQVYGLWLNKADLVKWGIQLVSDSSAHMLSTSGRPGRRLLLTEPHIPCVSARAHGSCSTSSISSQWSEPIVPVPEPVISMVRAHCCYVEQGSALVTQCTPFCQKSIGFSGSSSSVSSLSRLSSRPSSALWHRPPTPGAPDC